MTNTARLNANPHMPRPGLRNFALHNLEVPSCFRNLHSFHLRHGLVSFAPQPRPRVRLLNRIGCVTRDCGFNRGNRMSHLAHHLEKV